MPCHRDQDHADHAFQDKHFMLEAWKQTPHRKCWTAVALDSGSTNHTSRDGKVSSSPIPSQNWLYHALNSHEVFNECQHLCSWKKPLPVVVAHFILEKQLSCCPVLRMCLQAEQMFRVAIDGLEQTLGKQHANSQAARGGLSRSC